MRSKMTAKDAFETIELIFSKKTPQKKQIDDCMSYMTYKGLSIQNNF